MLVDECDVVRFVLMCVGTQRHPKHVQTCVYVCGWGPHTLCGHFGVRYIWHSNRMSLVMCLARIGLELHVFAAV